MGLDNSIILDQNPDFIPRRRVPLFPEANGSSFLSTLWSLAKSYYNIFHSEALISPIVLQARIINYIIKFTQFVSGKIDSFDQIVSVSSNFLSAIVSSGKQGIILLTPLNIVLKEEGNHSYDENTTFHPSEFDSSYHPILQLTFIKDQGDPEFLTLGYINKSTTQNDGIQYFTLTKQQANAIAEFTVTFATLNQYMSLGISLLVGFGCGRVEHWFQISCSDLRWNGGSWKNSGTVILPYSITNCEFSPSGDIAYVFSKGHNVHLIEITGYDLKELELEKTDNTISASWCGSRQLFLLTRQGDLILYKQNDLGKWIKTALFDISSQIGPRDYIGAKVKCVRGKVAFLLPPGSNKISILSWERGLALPECTILTLRRNSGEETVEVSDFDVDCTGTCIGVINTDNSTVLFYNILDQYQNKILYTANNENKVAENVKFVDYVAKNKAIALIRWSGGGSGMTQVCSFDLPIQIGLHKKEVHTPWRTRQSYRRAEPYISKIDHTHEKELFRSERRSKLSDPCHLSPKFDWKQNTYSPLAWPRHWEH